MTEEPGDEDSLLDSKFYFNLKDAADEVSTAIGAKETAAKGTKLIGKTASNVAVFSGKLGLKLFKNLPKITAALAEEISKTKK